MPPFVHAMPVGFADVDHAGIVYYPRFFHFFHQAFEALWRERRGPAAYAELIAQRRLGFPAVRAACDFRSPLRFGDLAEVELRVARLGRTSLTFGYRVVRLGARERALVAEGEVVCAMVDLARFVAVPVPAEVQALLADLVEPST
ncbi:MAG: thioesterase family protein [Kofleriaceae bacterium]